jgi:predicted ABC-type ATPase
VRSGGAGEIILIAGPNGAGKTSFAKAFLPFQLASFQFLNADEIARRLPAAGMTQAAIDGQAGRLLIAQVAQAIARGENIILETTLSGGIWARHIPAWRAAGYVVTLYYLRLPSADVAVASVRNRVASGGHAIPEAVIRRRFDRSWTNLERLYKPLVDQWYVVEGLVGPPPVLLDSGSN